MSSDPLIPADYGALFTAIRERIRLAQYEALRAVNRQLVELYWDIGRLIVEQQEDETWGRSVVGRLAKDLQTEFPGVSGYSARNLWYMRQFYLAYRDNQKLQPLVAEISWTYEKTLVSQTNFADTLLEPIRDQARLAVKDAYTFDFLELGDEHSERQLEAAILAQVEPFLREMGGRFSFVGSQYRLEVSGKEYFIDLLLFHRALRSQYVGKMQFYLAVLDDTVRLPDENPAIGIILCKSKDKTIVEYALRESNKPIGVASYRIVRALPEELKGQTTTGRSARCRSAAAARSPNRSSTGCRTSFAPSTTNGATFPGRTGTGSTG